jgi:pyridoxamine 5'-phosphate oxidase
VLVLAGSWQLRLRVRLEVDDRRLQASSRWARLKLTPAAQDYLSPLPPGSPLASRYEPQRASREHFAVVTAQVLSLDWLELHADGHRRARFGPDGAQWLQP